MSMTRFGWLIAFLLIVILAIVGTFVFLGHRAMQDRPTVTATSTPVTDPSALSIYTNGTYGFTFFYPADARLTDTFGTTTDPMQWRENAVATGTLIADVQTDGGEARIGASTAKKELAACSTAGAAEQQQASLIIASTTWNVFSFDRVGTDAEERIMSYRAKHDGSCFALETVEPLAQAASTTLPAPDLIIRSFSFANP